MEVWMERCRPGFGGLRESKNRKPFMSAWKAGTLPVTWLLLFLTSKPELINIMADWNNAQGKGTD